MAQVGGGVGPHQLIANCFHNSETLVLPGTFRQQTPHLYLSAHLMKATEQSLEESDVSTGG